MKLSVALFFAGLFGALATVFILLSFGTDYWLLASESCPPNLTGSLGPDGKAVEHGDATLHGVAVGELYHEGFFWKCSVKDVVDDDENLLLKFWFTNQPQPKFCVPAYLFPFPVSDQTHNATQYNNAIIYRGFWSVFMLIGVAAVVLGGFIIICAAPFASHHLYKVGGGFFLTSGFFLLCVVVMYVLWLQVLDVLDVYVDQKRSSECPDFRLSVTYGLSFMFAPVGIFFCLIAGILFLFIGRTVQIHYH
ncbi:transmembrane protein 182 [Cololabis saira]|uniref:transmembrane protein 182 n=1 Tax=Cololabis saira TaxID=129043 RepID=UPI002AD3B3E8|nr:transmembrane protein 182 [Cololabis saira]